MRTRDRPVLWHIAVSHFSEKARWALDYKRLAHVRRTPLPGLHIPAAYWLSRASAFTLPILELDGRRIADSTAIIAALEQRVAEPALYPQAQDERRRALELEEWFDEELAPYARRLAFYELRRDPELLREISARVVPALADKLGPGLVPYTSFFTGLRYRAADPAGAEHARERILLAFDRLEAGLGDGEYLVGGRFTVADLSAAALLYPLVLPAHGPPAIVRMPEPYEAFRALLRERRGYRWVQEMYSRHRLAPSAGTDAPERHDQAARQARPAVA
jgi:glutathione S-transferase